MNFWTNDKARVGKGGKRLIKPSQQERRRKRRKSAISVVHWRISEEVDVEDWTELTDITESEQRNSACRQCTWSSSLHFRPWSWLASNKVFSASYLGHEANQLWILRLQKATNHGRENAIRVWDRVCGGASLSKSLARQELFGY